jgi:hypothetical protein
MKVSSAALAEATQLSEALKRNDSKAVAQDMDKIIKHIELAKRGMKQSLVQSKNVLRVLLGMTPQNPRNGESVFPVDKPVVEPVKEKKSVVEPAKVIKPVVEPVKEMKPVVEPVKVKKSVVEPAEVMKPVVEPVKATNPVKPMSNSAPPKENAVVITSAEVAIESAITRFSISGENINSLLRGKNEKLIYLTEIETLILFTVISHGIPLSYPCNPNDQTAFSWSAVGIALRSTAFAHFNYWNARLINARHLMQRMASNISQARLAVETDMLIAQKRCIRLQEAATQATEYALEPQNLAPKTIVLLNKFIRHVGSINGIALFQQPEDGSGNRVSKWLEQEVTRLSNDMSLYNENGDVMAYVATDFLNDIPESARHSLQVAASFDNRDCRMVINQIATVTRVRSIMRSSSGDNLYAKLLSAVNMAESKGFKMVAGWWNKAGQDSSGIHHDFLALNRLLESGYGGVMDSKNLYSNNDMVSGHNTQCEDARYYTYSDVFLKLSTKSFKEVGLNIVDIQNRINTLTCELHLIDERCSNVQTDKPKSRRRSKNPLNTDKNASPKPSSSPLSSVSPNNNDQSGGLLAFFGSSNSSPNENINKSQNLKRTCCSDVEVCSAPGIATPTTMPPKVSYFCIDLDQSPEKKQRT